MKNITNILCSNKIVIENINVFIYKIIINNVCLKILKRIKKKTYVIKIYIILYNNTLMHIHRSM